jgi:hypothetical protein
MFQFKPAIWRDGVLYELPRPLTSVRLQDSWDYARFKVPLDDGDWTAGHSRNGVDIALEGRVGSHAGILTLSEEEMFAALETLRTHLDASPEAGTFELFLYHDPATGTYRSFRDCCTVRFEYELTDPRLFTYSTVIHAADPTIHTSAPA